MKTKTLTLLTLALVSCVQGPNYKRPDVDAPGKWKEGKVSSNAQVPDEWWKLFHDSTLNRLITQAFEQNQDLRGALARIETARAIIGVKRSQWFPQLNFGGSFAEQHASASQLTASGINSPLAFGKLERQNYATSFDLSYEADLWGKVRRGVESARADMKSQEETLDFQRLSIAAEVAKNYFLLRSHDAQHAIVVATIKSRQEALDLQESKFKAGLTNESDTTRARTEVELARADLALVVRVRGAAEHAIAVLCGKAPVELSISKNGASTSPPNVPVGMPSELLLRRPDVRAAEQRLVSANAQIGVAKAEFFPSFKLIGAGGFQSIDAGTFLDWQNRVLSIGPSISVPVFTGGRNKANLQAAQSRYNEELASYKQIMLISLREVEDALLDLKTYAMQRDALEAAMHSAEDTERLARTRQEKGLTSFFEVVDANRTVLSTRLLLAQTEGQRMVSTVQLLKAIGGGWKK
jgi:outer membrane protein, multidrug efflux system